MKDALVAFARIEFLSEAKTWLALDLDPATYAPDIDFNVAALLSDAENDGALEEALPTTVSELCAYLGGVGWTVAITANAVELTLDHLSHLELDAEFVGGAVAVALFASAIEKAGARGYLYLVNAGPLREELPLSLRLIGLDGTLEITEPERGLEQMEFNDAVGDRLWTAASLWSVSDDLEAAGG